MFNNIDFASHNLIWFKGWGHTTRVIIFALLIWISIGIAVDVFSLVQFLANIFLWGIYVLIGLFPVIGYATLFFDPTEIFDGLASIISFFLMAYFFLLTGHYLWKWTEPLKRINKWYKGYFAPTIITLSVIGFMTYLYNLPVHISEEQSYNLVYFFFAAVTFMSYTKLWRYSVVLFVILVGLPQMFFPIARQVGIIEVAQTEETSIEYVEEYADNDAFTFIVSIPSFSLASLNPFHTPSFNPNGFGEVRRFPKLGVNGKGGKFSGKTAKVSAKVGAVKNFNKATDLGSKAAKTTAKPLAKPVDKLTKPVRVKVADAKAKNLTAETTGKAAKVKAGDEWTASKAKGRKTSEASKATHFEKHGSEFKDANGAPKYKTAKEYTQGAKDFLNKPPKDTLTKKRADGDTVRFNEKSGEYASMSKNGKVRTYYKPTPKKSPQDKKGYNADKYKNAKEYFYGT